VSPSCDKGRESVPATPAIPLSQFKTIGINSPASGSPNCQSSQNSEQLLRILDPHRDLSVTSTIVMTCGFGGFAQLGLGEEEDETEEKNGGADVSPMDISSCNRIQSNENMKKDHSEGVDFTAKFSSSVNCGTGTKRPRVSEEDFMLGTPENPIKKQKVKWPAPNVVEARVPLRMPNLDDLRICSVVMGIMHGAVVLEDGRIFVWGGNDHCNLGFKGEDAWVPTEITKHFPVGTKIKKVTCGSSHSVFLSTEGEVFTAGTFKNDGWEGAFYDPQLKKVYKQLEKPTKLEYIRTANTSAGDAQQKKIAKMKDIASGLDHMLMLDVDGNLWEMGVTCLGQRTSRRNQHTYLQPRRVGIKDRSIKFRAVRCGSHYNLAITTENDLYTWGQNNFHQCGHRLRTGTSKPELIDLPHKVNFNDPSVKVYDVGAGTHTTIALDTSGRIWSFGRNGSFELGRETEVPPKKIIDGRLQQFSNEPKPDLAKQVTAIDKPIKQISVGANHWFAVANDSTTYAVGVNLEFRTGVGEEEGASRFVKLFHDGNLRNDFEIVDISAGSNSSAFLLKRVRKRRKNKKRNLTASPARRQRRKVQSVKKK